ncbi:unnamed protein product [Oreochromis niloticus]|nr:unnamed protein product [Mustela putorius furo]
MMATKNYVAELNEYAQRNRLKLKYEYLGSDGPDHNKVFSQKAIIDGKDYPKGVGKTKKDAKLKAAENALRCLLDGKCQDLQTENAAEASTPAETDINFICWLNEYGQRNRLTIKPMETARPGPNNAIPWCSFMVGDKEYPAVSGTTAREAKEEAAKLVYDIINGNKTTDTADENHSDGSGQQSENLRTELDLCTTTKNLTVNSKDPSLMETNYIGLVNDFCQRENCSRTFVEEKICGTPDKRQFFYKLLINNKQYPVGKGKSIKEAKQSAARQAWFVLQEQSSKEDAKDKNVGNGQNEMPTVSRFISEFEPLEHLGKGAFGSVYKVRHKQLKKEYAVKIGGYKEKSLREVSTLSDLFHRNIVRYYTFWMQDTGYEWDLRNGSYDSYASSHTADNPETKFLYIQMELCAKNTLRDWIDEKNKESVQNSKRREESLRIAQEIVCGVEYIHSKNHIHRDLKPANIMFGVEGEVKIGDFGLVTSDDDDEERTVCKGTPSYMAPEQRSERKYDRKVDMFALGLIFFELLWKLSTGYERAKIWPDVRRQRFPEEFSVTFTKEKQIINSLLSEKPEDRPDASAVKAELEEWTRIFNSHKASCQENQTV